MPGTAKVALGRRHLRRAQLLFRQGQYEASIAELQDAARRIPGDGLIQLHLGLAALEAVQYDVARPALERACTLLPRRSFPLCALAALLIDRGQPQQACKIAERARSIEPRCIPALALKALAAWDLGDRALALRTLGEVPAVHIRLLDGRLLARIERALITANSPQTPVPLVLEGEKSFSPLRFPLVLRTAQALGWVVHPFDAKRRTLRAHFIAGQSALEQHRFKQAAAAFSRAVACDPDPFYQFLLAEAQLLAGQIEQAQATVNRIQVPETDVASRRDVDTLRGIIALRLNRVDEAVRLLATLGPHVPPHTAYFRGWAYVQRNQLDRAARDLLMYTMTLPPAWLRQRLQLTCE